MRNIFVVGIDITKKGLVLSYSTSEREQPNTISEQDKETSVVFPLTISKEKGLGRWYVGFEAEQRAVSQGDDKIDNLYERALMGEKIQIDGISYDTKELFTTYLRKIIDETGFFTQDLQKLVVTVPKVDERAIDVFSGAGKKLSLDKNTFMLIDHSESYIYFTLSQNPSIFQDDVCLFEYDGERMLSCILQREGADKPNTITLHMDKTDISYENRDEDFLRFIEKTFENRTVSATFLTGESFNTEWMERSLPMLCEERRVFMGDNLYSKGACYAGIVKLTQRNWPYEYVGDHEMKISLSLKVSGGDELSLYPLIKAGENWYETSGECEVILDGTPQFECWVQNLARRSSTIQQIVLNKMPRRRNRTTRLRIHATPISDVKVQLTVTDLGFGDIAPSSGKVWEHVINMEEG